MVTLLHGYFCYLEMFVWDTPRGRAAFRMTPEFSAQTKTLAANQGLYNAFLSVGLFYASLTDNVQFKFYFLGCVVVAGVFGAYTVTKKIFYLQALPALAAMGFLYLSIQK